jgi:hypothetical protein
MTKKLSPKLRNTVKGKALYPLNSIPQSAIESIAQQVFAFRSISSIGASQIDVSGSLWEKIFSKAIGAVQQSAVAEGLDDIQLPLHSMAWGAKTVKHTSSEPLKDAVRQGKKRVSLISGRNSPTYSFGTTIEPNVSNPADIGEQVISIWNSRVLNAKKRFNILRNVVLIKGEELGSLCIFEKDTDTFDHNEFDWRWNKNNNLEGSKDKCISFVWQPHGSQFTIKNVQVPSDSRIIHFKRIAQIPIDDILTLTDWDRDVDCSIS